MRVVNLLGEASAEGEVEVVVYARGETVVIVINGARGCLGRIVVPTTGRVGGQGHDRDGRRLGE